MEDKPFGRDGFRADHGLNSQLVLLPRKKVAKFCAPDSTGGIGSRAGDDHCESKEGM